HCSLLLPRPAAPPLPPPFPTRRSSDLSCGTASPAGSPLSGSTGVSVNPNVPSPPTDVFSTVTVGRLAFVNEQVTLCPGCTSRITDRKSTRLNSSHVSISYAVFCLKNKI